VVSQPLGGGVPRHVADLVGALEGQIVADVACPRDSQLWQFLSASSHVTLHPMSSAREPSPRDLVSVFRVARLARRADVIHAHSSKAGLVARLAALLVGRSRRCVFTPHGWSFWAVGGALGRAARRWERLGARWCGRIVALSDAERRAGLAAGVGASDTYAVVRNGVDLERFDRPAMPVPGRILVLGRLAATKRLDLAIDVLRRVRREHPHAELHLVGDGPDRARIERLATTDGLAGAVHLLGEREDVPELLASAACLLLTSDSESCPLSIIEAMAAGVPAVATRVGGVPELLEHGKQGFLVPPGGADEAAEAVAQVLRDASLARELGEQGRARAQARFGLDRMAAETVAVYETLA
jgi:glycosyltransferase involved in cell wall biosynthesis